MNINKKTKPDIKIGCMQPQFLPHERYFELIHMSDIFIIMDDAQFSYQSWQHRAKLVFDGKEHKFGFPIKEKFLPLNQTKIDYDHWDRAGLFKSIEQNYRRTPFFERYYPRLKELLEQEWDSVSIMNVKIILLICALLGMDRKIRFSSDHPSSLRSSERVRELLQIFDADVYISAKSSFEYMKAEGVFPLNDIEVMFQDHICQPYKQNAKSFIPYMCIFDALFNVGAEETRDKLILGTKRWNTWDDMINAGSTVVPNR